MNVILIIIFKFCYILRTFNIASGKWITNVTTNTTTNWIVI